MELQHSDQCVPQADPLEKLLAMLTLCVLPMLGSQLSSVHPSAGS